MRFFMSTKMFAVTDTSHKVQCGVKATVCSPNIFGTKYRKGN